MKELKQSVPQQSQHIGSTTDSKNLNSELVKKRKLGIFELVEIEETGDIFLAVGRIKIKSYESVEDATEDLNNRDWDLLVNLITGLIVANEIMKKENELKK